MTAGDARWLVPLLALLAGTSLRQQPRPYSGRRPVSSRAFRSAKARALLRSKLPCLGCHPLEGEGGRLAPPLDSASLRRSPEYIAAMLDKPDSVVPGTIMPRIPMDRSTRDLLVEYLAGRTPSQTARRKSLPEPVARPGGVVARDGASLYARYCAPCHGLRGGGDGPNARFLPVPPARHSSSAVMSQRSDDALFDTIYGGGAVMNRSNLMPPYGATLSGGEIRSLVLHIRKLCGCRGPAWSRRP